MKLARSEVFLTETKCNTIQSAKNYAWFSETDIRIWEMVQSMQNLEDHVRMQKRPAVFGFHVPIQHLLIFEPPRSFKLSTSVPHTLHTPVSPHLPL